MPEDLRLPAIAAAALTMCLVVALMQRRERPASTALPVWRTRGDGGWTGWNVLRGGEVFDRAVADLAGHCLAHAIWPESANVAYHAVLNTAVGRSGGAGQAVQFAIVRAPEHGPEFTTDILFVSPVHDAARGR